jgi:hypothetical protein
MKTLLLSLSIFITGFSSFSQVDSVAVLQSFIDSLNAVPVVSLEPNEKYLKTLSHVYIPSVEDYENDPMQMILFIAFLESRYKCNIEFMQEDSTNGVRDILFEVSQKKDVVFSALILKLSVVEQLHQEGELICQLDEFCKWSDLIVNW